MKEGPYSSFNHLIVLIGVSPDAYARRRANGDKLGICVEAVNQLLKSYATNANFCEDYV